MLYLIIAIKLKEIHSGDHLNRIDRESSGRDLSLGKSNVKKEEKSIPPSLGGEFLIAGSGGKENGVILALRKSEMAHRSSGCTLCLPYLNIHVTL